MNSLDRHKELERTHSVGHLWWRRKHESHPEYFIKRQLCSGFCPAVQNLLSDFRNINFRSDEVVFGNDAKPRKCFPGQARYGCELRKTERDVEIVICRRWAEATTHTLHFGPFKKRQVKLFLIWHYAIQRIKLRRSSQYLRSLSILTITRLKSTRLCIQAIHLAGSTLLTTLTRWTREYPNVTRLSTWGSWDLRFFQNFNIYNDQNTPETTSANRYFNYQIIPHFPNVNKMKRSLKIIIFNS